MLGVMSWAGRSALRIRLSTLMSLCALSAVLSATRGAEARDSDPTFGRDKLLHFSVSASIAGVGYAASVPWLDRRWQRLLVGGSLALAAGIAKELRDSTGRGDPSWKDLAWDGAGTSVGLGVALSIDVLASPRRRRPRSEAAKP
jgi:uncharacterized protein YfiM (DUF2279 family)